MSLNILLTPSNVLQEIDLVLAVAAGKGGVGKSTLAVNLSLLLKQQGLKVGLLDADIYGPSTLQMLPSGMHPAEAEREEERGKILPGSSLGIPFISLAHFKKEASCVRAPVANALIEQFLNQVVWGKLDVLVVDFPPGTGDIQLTLMQKAKITAALIVTTPQEVALIDVRRSIEMFLKMHVPIIGVVENMSYFTMPHTLERIYPFGRSGGKRLSEEFSLEFLGEIPLDPTICKVADEGESLFEKAPDSEGGVAFQALGIKLLPLLKNFPRAANMKVRQLTAEHIELTVDNISYSLLLREIQKHCPCVRCSGKQKKQEERVTLLEFSFVGRYALRFVFSSGCSLGLYPLELLKTLVSM